MAPLPPALAHIEAWIFDLDNTLYPSSAKLFDQIDVKMGAYIQRLLNCDQQEARRVQKGFFHSHGTTLSGLMEAHGTVPADFLDYVHDIDLSVLAEDRRVIEGLARLPGRKLVFTNGDETYARRVLFKLGLSETFEAVHDIHATAYVPKPKASAYQGLCDTYAIDPRQALFVEDMAQNLAPAKALGMTTVWVNNGSERGAHGAHPDFIDFEIADVGDWLEQITGGLT